MTKYYCKNDWESTIYKVKYGKFESILKVIAINMDPRTICSSSINKGNFGEVFKFQVDNKKAYALKNIKVDN